MNTDMKALLQAVQNGSVSVDDALLQLKKQPFEDLGFAKVDLHRRVRQGANEVIYGAGKTADQIIGILDTMAKNGQENVLITRLDREKADIITQKFPISYYENARVAIAGQMAKPNGIGKIVIATGGTSDSPVAEEAAQKSGLDLGSTLKILAIAAPLLMSLLGKTAQSQQQAQTQSATLQPLQQSAQQSGGGLDISSLLGGLLKNVDIGKLLLSLLK